MFYEYKLRFPVTSIYILDPLYIGLLGNTYSPSQQHGNNTYFIPPFSLPIV